MRNIKEYSKEYLNEEFELIQVKYRRKKVLEQIKKYNPQRVLEIGCGMEPLFSYVDGINFTIVEPSEEFVINARKLAGNSDKVKIYHAFFEDVFDTFVNEKFDMVICSSLLHEVEEPDKFVKNIWRVCHEKTIVHINVPNANSLHRLLALECGYIADVKTMSERNLLFQQNTIFDMDSMTNICERNGFDICDVGTYFIKPFTHAQMQQILQHEIINMDVLDGFDNLIKYMPELGSELFVNCMVSTNK